MGGCCSTCNDEYHAKINKDRKKKVGHGQAPSISHFTEETVVDEGQDVVQYVYWDEIEDLKDDGIRESHTFHLDGISLTRPGKVYPLFRNSHKSQTIDMLSKNAARTYEKLDVFYYRPQELIDAKSDNVEITRGILSRDCDDNFYLGELNKKLQKHGRGIVVYNDGAVYEGFFKNDCRHGAGRLIQSNGDTYQGEWKDDQCYGFGIFVTYKELTKIKGYWENGNMNGDGYEEAKDQYVYRGDFTNGLKHGTGLIKFDSGDQYVGDFVEGVACGKGEWTHKDGKVYTGDFKDNKFHGKGKLKSSSNSYYQGDFKEGLKDGHGKFYIDKNTWYEGPFKNDLQHGEGIFHKKKKGSRRGIWKKGIRQKYLD